MKDLKGNDDRLAPVESDNIDDDNVYILRLYVAGQTRKSLKAFANLKKIHWSSVKVEVSILLSILYNLNILNSHNGTSVIHYS